MDGSRVTTGEVMAVGVTSGLQSFVRTAIANQQMSVPA